MKEYPSFDLAYFDIISELKHRGVNVSPVRDKQSVGSAFGEKFRETTELAPLGFTLLDPRARVLRAPSRNMNMAFAIANFLWTASGSSAIDLIEKYNPIGAKFTHDGRHLAAAFGARIFGSGFGRQFDAVVEKIKADPSTRRAVIALFTTSDLINNPLDTPCAVSMQYLLRGDKLHAITYMRSQSAVRVMPYDVFLFTMIHELLATSLGCQLGSYTHICGSLHYYEDEVHLVGRIVAEHAVLESTMPEMPLDSYAILSKVINIEERLCGSEAIKHMNEDSLSLLADLPPYWQNMLKRLIERRITDTGINVSARFLQLIQTDL